MSTGTSAVPPREGTAKPSACHYCAGHATTRDHIVPRSVLINRPELAGLSAPINTVPACLACNQVKGSKRSTCDCSRCLRAWAWFGPLGWPQLPQVDPSVGHWRFRTDQEHPRLNAKWQYDTGR